MLATPDPRMYVQILDYQSIFIRIFLVTQLKRARPWTKLSNELHIDCCSP